MEIMKLVDGTGPKYRKGNSAAGEPKAVRVKWRDRVDLSRLRASLSDPLVDAVLASTNPKNTLTRLGAVMSVLEKIGQGEGEEMARLRRGDVSPLGLSSTRRSKLLPPLRPAEDLIPRWGVDEQPSCWRSE